MVYTANWGIIYHLPPIEKIHDKNQPSLIGTGSCGPEFTRRDIYLDIVGFQPQQTQEILDLFLWGGLKMGRNNVSGQFFFGRVEDVCFFPMDL